MAALDKISASVTEFYAQEEYAEKYSCLQIYAALDEVKSDTLRDDVLNNSIRIDGRKPEDIRQISCEVSFLPKTHGSSLFTRGETQALVVTTLGTGQDEQIIDSLDGEYKEHFMLNYIFPPYSVGETTPLRAPNRREVGHGKLAWRAINRVLPTKAQFPYTVRVVSEITESNGSSSMATVCGASMALMDAGVPIKSAVAGIAMGLIKKDNNFVVLSDILGDEDYLGDMDFKVAGSKEGVTALQMDIKVLGITFEVMQQALKQAKNGRIHILAQMEKAILNSNKEISKNAPAIISFKVEKDKIREIIGPGGKVIREICETTGAKIDITDDGNVSVSAVGKEKLDAAVARVKAIAFDPDIGDIFEGPVVKILESGAFVNYLGSRDGFVHISEISEERIPSVSSMLIIGDIVKVKIIGFDKGKVKLSIKAVSKQASDKSSKSTTNDHPAKEKEHNHKKASSEQSPSDSGGVVERKYFN
jgi:polyribonucleotide nucleotidyltransferase